LSVTGSALRSTLTRVGENRGLGEEIYLLRFREPALAAAARPGQFVMVSLPDLLDPLLPRPFAVFDTTGQSVAVLYKRAGKGTRLLSGLRRGDALRVLGPLGNGYTLPPAGSQALVLAGGIGFASVHFQLRVLVGMKFRVQLFYGTRSAEQLYPTERLERAGLQVHLATEDGRRGFPGQVLALFRDRVGRVPAAGNAARFAYVCGPPPMLKAAAALLGEYGIRSEFSLESRMACGFGVCQGCVVRTRVPGGAEVRYQKVCADGPVFDPEAVIWGTVS
jgi:dihydroorotate dehydrogenase electron transfer subunit